MTYGTNNRARKLLDWTQSKFPDRELPDHTRAFLLENPEMIPGFILLRLESSQQNRKSNWDKLFDGSTVDDPTGNFTHFNFGEQSDPGDEAEEMPIGAKMSGYEMLASMNRSVRLASIWAQGRYLKAHPEARRWHVLLGLGAQRELDKRGLVYPIYTWEFAPIVRIVSLQRFFDAKSALLVRK